MKKKITIIHTTAATLAAIPALIQEQYPAMFELVNVLDDSLLNEIKTRGEMTKGVIERFLQYAIIAQHTGNDAILLACSSIGKAGDIARKLLTIPLFKIDEPMAELAVTKGNRILVLGTVKSTLAPTCELIESKRKDEQQLIDRLLIPDVFELYATQRETHDRAIAKVIKQHLDHYDVIVLAQASMAHAAAYLDAAQDRLLTSLPLGLAQLASLLSTQKG